MSRACVRRQRVGTAARQEDRDVQAGDTTIDGSATVNFNNSSNKSMSSSVPSKVFATRGAAIPVDLAECTNLVLVLGAVFLGYGR